MSDFPSCFPSPAAAGGEAENLASPRPQGTGGSITSPCHFSEPGMLLTVHAANLGLAQFKNGMERNCTCSMMPLNSCYSFCFTTI